MYFVTYVQHNEEHAGVLYPNRDYILPLISAEKKLLGEVKLPASMLAIIEAGDLAIARVQEVIEAAQNKSYDFVPAKSVKLCAPIPRLRKNIFCIGKNYVEHAFEFEKTRNNDALPKHPVVFSKPPTCVIGPEDKIQNHKDITSQLDYEAELAVVIGKKASKVAKENAYDYVFGYTMMNDVTARDLQKRHLQWIIGKGADTFAPMGPSIAHKSIMTNPHALSLKSYVNGELRQNGHTGDMIFDIPTLIATITSAITLEPGDIIATGTPAGVGAGFIPPKFLQSGDVVEIELENLGKLKNTVE